MPPQPETRAVDLDGVPARILVRPPPHLIFLGSQVDAEKDDAPPLATLARMGGLAALVVRELDGEEVVFAAGMPRTLADLEVAGRGFVMAAFERVGSYEALGELFRAILHQYDAGTANPT